MRISDWSSDVCSSDLGLDTGAVIEHGMTSTLQFVHQVPDLLAATATRDHHSVVSRDDDHVLQPDGGEQRPASAEQAVLGGDGHHTAVGACAAAGFLREIIKLAPTSRGRPTHLPPRPPPPVSIPQHPPIH